MGGGGGGGGGGGQAWSDFQQAKRDRERERPPEARYHRRQTAGGGIKGVLEDTYKAVRWVGDAETVSAQLSLSRTRAPADA